MELSYIPRFWFFCFISFSASADVTTNLISTPGFDQAWRAEQSLAPTLYLKEITAKAESGDNNARWWLVDQFSLESSPFYNPEKALYWLRMVADQDRPDAQYRLGKWLLEHDQIAHNEAISLLREAAQQDWVPAMLLLFARAYVSQDEAGTWLERAASLGNAEAQFHYGLKLFQSEKNQLASRFLWLSAEQNYLPAIEQILVRPQSQLDAEEGRVWSLLMGLLQLQSEEALKIFLSQCSDQYRAKYRRVVIALVEQGMPELDAINTIKKWVEPKLSPAINASVAQLLHDQRYQSAESLMIMNAQVLSPKHLYRLGYLYRAGANGKADWGSAQEFYYRAAVFGHPAAFNGLGVLYEKELIRIDHRDPKQVAAAFYKESARLGYQRAVRNLEDLY